MNEIIIKVTPTFEKKAKKLLAKDAFENLLDYLEEHPEQGDLIRGTGGIRKLRWKTGKSDKGKSGGVRVLYHYTKNILILLITLYSKSDKENITQHERNELKRMLPLLVKKYSEDL
jgi:mRNA-degrading endonuclease RelE of RelBE toxin-antitoxin system